MNNSVRAKNLLFALGLWSVIAVATHLYFAVYAQHEYLKKGDEIAMRRGVIPAPRGQILDKNGIKLAWTDTHYDLYITRVPSFYLKRSTLFKQLRLIFGEFELEESPSGEFIIKRNLTPDRIHALQTLLKEYRELALRMRFERCYIDDDIILAKVGDVEEEKGIIRGVSGLELQFDKELSGQHGRYVVMVDNMERWITGKWELEQKVVPGIDIILKESVEELTGGSHE